VYAGVMRLAAELAEPERDRWLRVILACYQAAGEIEGGEFEKSWVKGLHDVPLSLRKLRRYRILEQVGSSRRKHRAYWRMADREGVRTALRELGYL
jgi:hypothetical protein